MLYQNVRKTDRIHLDQALAEGIDDVVPGERRRA